MFTHSLETHARTHRKRVYMFHAKFIATRADAYVVCGGVAVVGGGAGRR